MSLGDGSHFAYICIPPLPPPPFQIKAGEYANAEAQVMAEVFIVVTSGGSTLQRLRTRRVTATSGRPQVGMEGGERERVEAGGVGVRMKVCIGLLFKFVSFTSTTTTTRH